MARLSLEHISRHFAGVPAVDDVGIDIPSGEFFSIVGPSGCGKTTLLRIIAGFESPTTGKIFLEGKDVTRIAPQFRSVGMVFQNYALFPHMTVRQNIAFGLETKGLGKAEIADRVERILRTVGLSDMADRGVPLLSGGEQQRVAVARAIVVEPSVLLFDEPLSNLDATLRVQTREEIRAIQRATGITTVYVTHDQAEAMSLSSRMAIMKQGRIEQVGIPEEVYERPSTPFVAQFLSNANLLHGNLDLTARLFVSDRLTFSVPRPPIGAKDGRIILAIRPDAVLIGESNEGSATGTITGIEYLGFIRTVLLDVAGTTIHAAIVSSDRSVPVRVGARVGVTIDWPRCTAYPEEP